MACRDADGAYRARTSHHPVAPRRPRGMFRGLPCGLLVFIPVVAMADGAGLGARMGKLTTTGLGSACQNQSRDLVTPGTCALMLEKVTRTRRWRR
jgi:uncharacterized membrane protein